MAELTTTEKDHASHRHGDAHRAARAAARQQRFFDITEEEEQLRLSRCLRCRLQQAGRVRRASARRRARSTSRSASLMKQGYGTIVLQQSGRQAFARRRHPQPAQPDIEGSLGYFGCGLIDGPNVHIKGRVGWSCGENMLAGTIVIEKNAGSPFGAAMRGGDLVCKGDVGAPHRASTRRAARSSSAAAPAPSPAS